MKKIIAVLFVLCVTVSVSLAQQTLVNATALRTGCRIISSPPTYYTSNVHTSKIDDWTTQALFDETSKIGWCSGTKAPFPHIFILELSESFNLTKLVFDNQCQKDYKGICTKDVRIEVSSESYHSGYSMAGSFTLKEYAVSEFPINTTNTRWIRLTILSNYGNRDYTELMDFNALGSYTEPGYDATNIVGMWDTNFDWVSVNSNQNGYIYGCYKWSNGELYAGTVDRRVFNFLWSQKSDGQKGWATLVINKEGTRLSGIWGFNNDPTRFGFWDFTKRSSTPYQCWNEKDVRDTKPSYKLKVDPPVVEMKPETTEVKPVIVNKPVKIMLVDAETNSFIEGKVTVLHNERTIYNAATHHGHYSFEPSSGQSYLIKAEADGYMPSKELLNAATADGATILLKLNKLETGKSVIMQNIHFEQGKYDLLAESNTELDKIVEMMNQYPSMEIELAGHTDNQGSAEKNVELSENRVKAVKNYLIKKGIKASRISGIGYGGANPIASNAKEETRKLNRRVEFKIIKM